MLTRHDQVNVSHLCQVYDRASIKLWYCKTLLRAIRSPQWWFRARGFNGSDAEREESFRL